MLKIRLQRIGRRNDPSFKVVVTEHTRGPKSGDSVERVGSYNPKTKATVLDTERILYWLANGAQPSDTIYNMLVKEGVIEGRAKNVLPQKSPVTKEQEEAPVETSETPAEGGDEKAQESESTEEIASEAALDETAEDTPIEETKAKEEEIKESEETTEEKKVG